MNKPLVALLARLMVDELVGGFGGDNVLRLFGLSNAGAPERLEP
jgi:hypothetical protein